MSKHDPSEGFFDEFRGIPFGKLFAQPLIAAGKAENQLAKEELRSLLNTCFIYEDGVYVPVMIEMLMIRGFLDPSDQPGGPVEIVPVETIFSVPLITLFPISSLGVDSVDISFNFEVTSQRERSPDVELPKWRSKRRGREGKKKRAFEFAPEESDVELLGALGNLHVASQESGGDGDGSVTVTKSGAYAVNLQASSLPLPNGLKTIIELYTKSITPEAVIEEETEEEITC